jgi:hypothetical protein
MTLLIAAGKRATIVQHCAIDGRRERAVRKFEVEAPRPYAQYTASISVYCVEPRRRRGYFLRFDPDNLRYLTIEVDGKTVFDSRKYVLCDMEKWTATNAEWRERELRASQWLR